MQAAQLHDRVWTNSTDRTSRTDRAAPPADQVTVDHPAPEGSQ